MINPDAALAFVRATIQEDAKRDPLGRNPTHLAVSHDVFTSFVKAAQQYVPGTPSAAHLKAIDYLGVEVFPDYRLDTYQTG